MNRRRLLLFVSSIGAVSLAGCARHALHLAYHPDDRKFLPEAC